MAGIGNKVYSVSRLQFHPLLNSIYHLHIPHYTLCLPPPPPRPPPKKCMNVLRSSQLKTMLIQYAFFKPWRGGGARCVMGDCKWRIRESNAFLTVYVSIAYCFTKLPALLPFAIGNPVRCFLEWELRSIAGITSFEHL